MTMTLEQIAMEIAIEMEIHATLGTTTKAKAEAISARLAKLGLRAETITDDMVERALGAALSAPVDKPDEDGKTYTVIGSYLSFNAEDAVELGVRLTETDERGRPRFHYIDVCHADELEETQRAILRPAVRAALTAALGGDNE